MSQYTASLPPDNSLKPSIATFFEQFYKTSDSPAAHEQYADAFTKDAKLIMGSNETNGREGIIAMRHKMWEKVAKRSHAPSKIFSFGANSNDVMLYGTVGYELKDGKSTTVDWSARAHFVEEGGALKMDFYQVYLDSAAMARAK